MSAIIVAGNEIIPDTLTVTVDGTEITAKDFQKVLLNINQASATASVADGTDLMQKMEIINKNANACDVSFKGEGGATVKNLKQNQSMRLSWTGSFWYVTFGGLLSGVANDGTPFNYTTEVTLDEVPVNTTYTTTEQDTGMTWIDGKKIYRKVFFYPNVSMSSQNIIWTETVNGLILRAWIADGSYYIMKTKTSPSDVFYGGNQTYLDNGGSHFCSMRLQFSASPYSNTLSTTFWTNYYDSFNFELCFVVEYIQAPAN